MPPQIPAPFLFRFAASVSYGDNARGIDSFEEAMRDVSPIPHFAQMEGAPHFADLLCVWNRRGLAFRIHVGRLSGGLAQRSATALDREGLQLWIDTRNTKNIHRASRFCHQFYFPVEASLPADDVTKSPGDRGEVRTKPPERISISNAREEVPVKLDGVEFRATKKPDGYVLDIWLPVAALNGFDPEASPSLGFYYLLRDRFRGEQYFSLDRAFPYTYDPSIWPTLELAK